MIYIGKKEQICLKRVCNNLIWEEVRLIGQNKDVKLLRLHSRGKEKQEF